MYQRTLCRDFPPRSAVFLHKNPWENEWQRAGKARRMGFSRSGKNDEARTGIPLRRPVEQQKKSCLQSWKSHPPRLRASRAMLILLETPKRRPRAARRSQEFSITRKLLTTQKSKKKPKALHNNNDERVVERTENSTAELKDLHASTPQPSRAREPVESRKASPAAMAPGVAQVPDRLSQPEIALHRKLTAARRDAPASEPKGS